MNIELRYYPTIARLPAWSPPAIAKRAVRTLKIGDVKVEKISDNINKNGLARSPFKPEIPPYLDPRNMLDHILEGISVDGVEVVDWMLGAFVDNVTLSMREIEYNLAGSQMVSKSGDGYIPGVRVEDIHVKSQVGRTVNNHGYYIVITPRGNFNVPIKKKAIGIFKDLLTWGSNSYLGSVQFTANLIKWKDLVTTPITKTIGFFMDRWGNIAPNFFVQKPRRPSLSVTSTIQLGSNDSQTIRLNFLDPTDYTNVVGTKSFDIAPGTSNITFTLTAIPFVPALISQIQPTDGVGTQLNSYDTTP